MSQSNTGQSGVKLTRYNELLQEARIKTDDAKRAVAAQFTQIYYKRKLLRSNGNGGIRAP